MTLVAGVLRRDASGRIATISPGAAVLFNGGTPTGPLGDLQVVTSAGAPPGVPTPTRDYALTGPALPADITFTRASVGTYFDAAGVMQTAAVNAPRFTYDPLTHEALGLLVEEARTNQCLAYNQFNNVTFWQKPASVVTPNATTAPDGTATADLLVANNASVGYVAIPGAGISMVAGSYYTQSMYMKLPPGTPFTTYRFLIDFAGAFGVRSASFNLVAGTATSTNPSDITTKIQAVGNGWFRCIATWLAPAAVTFPVQFARTAIGTNGDGVNGVYVWGAQWEDGAFETSLIKTAGAAATRSADNAVVTGAAFSGFWNQTQGTMAASGVRPSPAIIAPGNYVIAQVDDGTSANRFILSAVANGNHWEPTVFVASASQATLTILNSALGASTVALAYAANNFAASANGGAVVTDLSGTVPVVNELVLGKTIAGTSVWNGTIKSFRYWNTALTTLQLQTLTSSGGGVRNGGLLYNNDGALVVADGGAIFGYVQGGLPVTSDGALCVAYGGTPARFLASIPFDAAGRVCMAAPVPPVELEAFDISFDDPAFG